MSIIVPQAPLMVSRNLHCPDAWGATPVTPSLGRLRDLMQAARAALRARVRAARIVPVPTHCNTLPGVPSLLPGWVLFRGGDDIFPPFSPHGSEF